MGKRNPSETGLPQSEANAVANVAGQVLQGRSYAIHCGDYSDPRLEWLCDELDKVLVDLEMARRAASNNPNGAASLGFIYEQKQSLEGQIAARKRELDQRTNKPQESKAPDLYDSQIQLHYSSVNRYDR